MDKEDETPGFLLVKIAGTKPPVYFIIDQPFWAHNDQPDTAEHNDHETYWVEEHTCPTNICPVEAIIWDGDADPHRVFEYVAHRPQPHGDHEIAQYGIDDWRAIFPELGGVTIDGTVIAPIKKIGGPE